MDDAIRQRQSAFDNAERTADLTALGELLTDDFLSIGPKGFVLDKEAWIGRHVHFAYRSLETREVDVRRYGTAAIVRNVQHNVATYDGEHVELEVRVGQVWVDDDGTWRLAGIQFSPMG